MSEELRKVSDRGRLMSRPALLRVVLALILIASLAWGFWPALVWLLESWRVHSYYSHGPIVALIGLAWLAWVLVRESRSASTPVDPVISQPDLHVASGLDSSTDLAITSDLGVDTDPEAAQSSDPPPTLSQIIPSWLPSAALLIGALGLQFWALRWDAYPASIFALLLLVAGGIGLMGGLRLLSQSFWPLLLLATGVPLPWIDKMAPPMAAKLASIVAAVGQGLGLDLIQSGPQLSVGEGAFVIGAPCTGFRTSIALISLAVLLSGLMGGSIPRRIAFVCAALPLGLFANGLRLLGLVLVADRMGVERGLSFFHGPASPIFFSLALITLLVMAPVFGIRAQVQA